MKQTQHTKARPLFNLASLAEIVAAYVQGKGYGTSSIRQENDLVLKQLGKSPALAIDIGGNIGEYTAEIRRRNPGTEIYTFEPSATNIQKLNQRFANDKKITIIPLAVSDNTGAGTLYSNEDGSGLGSLIQRKLEHFNIDFNVKESVNTIRFEDFWNTNLKNRNLDIVKIDIEGFELAALNGFGKAIFSTNIIQFEFGGCNIDTRTYFQDFWIFFKDHNFDLLRITPLGIQSIKKYKSTDEYFSTTNYIAVNKNFK
jgi:FkbM family methyltransferase